MKKFLTLTLAALMLIVAVTGCGGSSSTAPPPASTAPDVTPNATPDVAPDAVPAELPIMGVCIYKYDDTYISTVRQALETVAAGKAELLLNDGKGDQAAQNDQIDLLIEKGVDVLVVNIVDIGAAQTVVDKAKKAGIPIIFFNREPDAEVLKSYDQARFVGTTAKDAGIIQGEIAVDVWKANPGMDRNGDGVISYVMLQGEPNNPEAIARTQFSVSTIVDAGIQVKELGLQICDWDASKAQVAMEAWLNKFGDEIEMVIANNDGMAQGAIAALNAIGYNTENDAKGYTPVLGVDATDAAKDLINRGMMTGTVLQDAQGMAQGVFALSLNAAQGKDYLDGTGYSYDDTGISVRIPYQPFAG